MTAPTGTGGAGTDPWAWLGLLKWSLSYSDGTKPSSEVPPMSAEDRAFLEKVMKEGIIDENERMKTILQQLTECMEYYKQRSTATTETDEVSPPVPEDDLEELLQELRDIVEQIDYARAFMSMKGVPFLLGCIQERNAVPATIRGVCLGLIATLCQNNPPVQKELLELGAIKVLSDLYFLEVQADSMKPKYMQAMSSIVRSHELAEAVMENLEQTVSLFLDGLDPSTASEGLRRRTLFFLRAYATSDSATAARVRQLAAPIGMVADRYLDETAVIPEFREMALQLLNQILEQKKSVDAVLERKTDLVSHGIRRIAALRKLSGDEREYAAVELEAWEDLIRLLARATPDEIAGTTTTASES